MLKKRTENVLQLIRKNQIPFLFVQKKSLDRIIRNHQGFVAWVSSKEWVSLDSILSASPNPFLVLLDEISDPQNLGAIIRSAEGAGVNGIIVTERRTAGLSEVVRLVSAGALEHVRVARVKNLSQAIDDCKKNGIWIIGAEGNAEEPWYAFDYKMPVGIVFGSEGKGLRPLVRKKCDKILSIPLHGKVSSLNVSAAASIFLYEVVRQRMMILE